VEEKGDTWKVSLFRLPPVRELILPDPGKILIDVDLSGADAQVVAWTANDEDLKAAFKAGLKIHIKNFEDFYQTKFEDHHKYKIAKGHIYPPYDEMKRGVHATNYGSSARTIAATLSWKTNEAENFKRRWFKLHPAIEQWHRRVDKELQLTGTIRNQFGYRIKYFERPSEVFTEALAWEPQSTVGIVCSRGGTQLDEQIPWVEILMQVHDSLVFQIPYHRFTPVSLGLIRRTLEVKVPFKDPLIIPWGIKASKTSMGHAKDISWEGEGLE
jgi:DNA polymerase I-like protein with 3'-5' exonuclease and polymerase domains